MTDDDRKRALDALALADAWDRLFQKSPYDTWTAVGQDMANFLRALASANDSAAEQQPVAWRRRGDGIVSPQAPADFEAWEWQPLYATPVQPVAQPTPAVAHPMSDVHINQGSMDSASDWYAAEYFAEKMNERLEADRARGVEMGFSYWCRKAIMFALENAAPTAAPTAAGWQFSVEQQGNRVALIVRGPKGQGASLDVDDSSVRAEVLRQFAADLAAAPKGAR